MNTIKEIQELQNRCGASLLPHYDKVSFSFMKDVLEVMLKIAQDIENLEQNKQDSPTRYLTSKSPR